MAELHLGRGLKERGLKAPLMELLGLMGGLNMLLRTGLSGSSFASLNGGSCIRGRCSD